MLNVLIFVLLGGLAGMSRLLAIPLGGVVFIGWILYKLFITRDLKKSLNDLYIGFVFFSIWILLYYLLMR